ncbi:CNOT8 CCR4-NOT transcription complex subunit 8 [Candida maltosa Xu316]
MMNVNPHLQYLQQQQQQQQSSSQQQSQQSQPQQNQQSNQTQSGQSPQLSQLQLQQLQRQQILSQHLQQQSSQQSQQQQQQQPQIGTPTSANPLLAILNGGANTGSSNTSGNLSSNPMLQQLQLQQLQQQQFQQLQQQQQQAQQQAQQQQQQQQVAQQPLPIIKEHEFQALRTFINDKTCKVYISVHQEVPGVLARPVGSFKSSSDYHFQTIRSNSDLLNLIQLSLCVIKITKNDVISSPIIWQFNFLYDLSKEMYNEESLVNLAQTSQINFQLHSTEGIPHFEFSELMIESGLIMDDTINWVSFHAGYDLGFFVSLLSNDDLPVDEPDFYWWCGRYFPNFFDLRYVGNQILNNKNLTSNTSGVNNALNGNGNGSNNLNGLNTPDDAKSILSNVNNNTNNNANNNNNNTNTSIEYLAEELNLLPISPAIRQHFTNSSFHSQHLTSTLSAYLSMECFKELLRRSNVSILNRFKGTIWGLGTFNENGSVVNEDEVLASARINGISTPSTPVGIINKGGMVHFGNRV